MNLADAVAIFLDAKMADGLSEETVRWYKGRLKRLGEALGEVEVSSVSSMDLRQFIVGLRKRSVLYEDHPYREQMEGGLSPSTRQGYVRAIKQLFGWLVQEGCIAEDPTRHIKLPPLPRQQPRAITSVDLGRLLKAAEGDEPGNKRDRALLLFLADTGCRVAGLAGLRLRDLDLAAGVAVVTEKGDKTRPVMFMRMTGQALRAWLEAREVLSEYVFPNVKTGERMLTSSVNHIIYRLRKRAGTVEGRCNPHAFRHAFAREYILNGGDLATLSEIMGHADVSVTKRYYSNFQYSELKEKHRRFSPVAKMSVESELRRRDEVHHVL